VFGDAELIIQRSRMFTRLNTLGLEVTEMKLGTSLTVFSWLSIYHLFLRGENTVDDSLATSVSNFRVPLPPKLRYDTEVKYMPSIPDNVKHWKVFEDDLEIKRFLETIDEFFALH
jgi:hypothetical protein